MLSLGPEHASCGASVQLSARVGNFEQDLAANADLELTGGPKAPGQEKTALDQERCPHHSGRFRGSRAGRCLRQRSSEPLWKVTAGKINRLNERRHPIQGGADNG